MSASSPAPRPGRPLRLVPSAQDDSDTDVRRPAPSTPPARHAPAGPGGGAPAGGPREEVAGAPTDAAPLSRQERKLRTRRAMLDAALDQLENRSFGAISLREVSRAASITPTAFYRHFASMEELGLALVDESFASLREMMRAARAEVQEPGDDIRASAATLVRHVGTHHQHYRFIARERSGGIASLRAAIAREIDSFTSELASDLRRYPVLGEMDAAGLEMVTSLMVTVMVATAERLLDAAPEDEPAILRRTEDHMRVVVLGAVRWGRE